MPRTLSMKSTLRLQGTDCRVQIAGKTTGRESWYHALLNALLVLNVFAQYISIRNRKR